MRSAIHLLRPEPGASRPGSAGIPEIVGESPAMRELFGALERLSRSPMTVLVNGESGTGKELVARAVHQLGLRKDAPFIALNMAAIPRDLLESELFGHEQGAFTGARARRPGRFEQADGGTLFLDEIGDMPAEMQTRLLRVLADGPCSNRHSAPPLSRIGVERDIAFAEQFEQRPGFASSREDSTRRFPPRAAPGFRRV